MSSFLQSQDWIDFQRSLGRKTFEIGGTRIVQNRLPLGKNYLYIPHGPAMDRELGIGNNELGIINQQGIQKLKNLGQQERAIFVKAEPLDDEVARELVSLGFKKSSKDVQPKKTAVIDLTQSPDDLLSRLHHKTRYNIKVAERHAITVEEKTGNIEDGIKEFWKLLKKTTDRDKFNSHTLPYYRQMLTFFGGGREIKTSLWLAQQNKTPFAGLILLTYKDKAYYLHGASDYRYRASMAPYALHWEIIKTLHATHYTTYDLWGIDANRYPGVTRFKLGWGGRVIEYPGAFDLTISWFWHDVYKILRRVRGR